MQIWSGLSRARTSPFDRSQTEARELRKSEHIDDIFNHDPVEEKDRRSARVHLSNASRALSEQFRQKVAEFLKDNPDVGEKINEIPLPGDDLEGVHPQRLVFRKFTAYAKWLQISGQQEKPSEPSEGDEPYLAVQQTGHDETIQALVAEQAEQQQALKNHRQKLQPNYYYMVYPETYSFN